MPFPMGGKIYEKLKHSKHKRYYTTKAETLESNRKFKEYRIKTLPSKERQICKLLAQYGEAVLSEIRLGRTVDEIEWMARIMAITEDK